MGIQKHDKNFLDSISGFTGVPFCVEQTSHEHIVEEIIQSAICNAYPKNPKEKKKKHITDFTHKCILDRNVCLRAYQKAYDRVSKTRILVVFRFWRAVTRNISDWTICWSDIFASNRLELCKQYKVAKAMLFYHNNHAKAYVKLDRLASLDLHAQRLEDSLACGDIQGIRDALKQLKSRKPKQSKHVRVIDKDGIRSNSLAMEKVVFRDHFSAQLGGTCSSLEENIVADWIETVTANIENVDPADVIKCLPGCSELASQFANTNPNRTFGEDTIPGIFLKKYPNLMATLYYPIVVKSCVRIRPPLQWRGGMLQELFKNKGSSADCECYRDILLGNISGKSVTKIIRKRVMPHARKICHHTQYGSGFNGGETAFAHLYIRMVFDMCKHNHLSAAFIFMDIVTAFAVLIRRIILMMLTMMRCGSKNLGIVDSLNRILKPFTVPYVRTHG